MPVIHRMLELEQILDMMWIQRWLTPFLHRFKMKHFAELQYLREVIMSSIEYC